MATGLGQQTFGLISVFAANHPLLDIGAVHLGKERGRDAAADAHDPIFGDRYNIAHSDIVFDSGAESPQM